MAFVEGKSHFPLCFCCWKKKIRRSLFGPPKLQTSVGIQKGHTGLTPFFHRCQGFQRLKKTTSQHPRRCSKRQGCRSSAAFYPFFCFYHFAPRNQFGHSHIDLCHGTIKTKCLRHHRHHAPANTTDHEGSDVLQWLPTTYGPWNPKWPSF